MKSLLSFLRCLPALILIIMIALQTSNKSGGNLGIKNLYDTGLFSGYEAVKKFNKRVIWSAIFSFLIITVLTFPY